MNIVLIGFRGTGKSTVGKILSKETGWKFISSDDEIENNYGKISNLVSDKGWEYFRRLEEDVIGNITKEDKTIIATGGGVVMNSNNVQNLKKNGKFILLTASKENMINRIKNSDRPRLTTGTCIEEEVDKILNERMPVYLSIADYIIETSSLTPKDIAEKIIKMVMNK
ncbi:Shikimate kinase [groundwater metagenome]|uniref:shikimate kinase n=1 Tax=groundwater metagenome TaxID=717931 RepID=A0A098E9K5_9ZZZZ